MSEEVVAPVEETVSAPAIAETPEQPAEIVKEEAKPQNDEKTFTKEEMDVAIGKAKAKAAAIAERRALKAYADKLEAMSQRQEQKPQVAESDGKPTMAQFANVEDYVEAVADWKLSQRDQANKKQQEEQSSKATYDRTEKIYAQAEKIQGFDRAAFDELPLTTSIAQAIIDSDIPAKLMAHLTINPEEVDRISKLSSARQAAEIGKLEAQLSSVTPVKASNAPAPIRPIGNRGGAATGDPARMSMEDYAAMRKSQGARWAR